MKHRTTVQQTVGLSLTPYATNIPVDLRARELRSQAHAGAGGVLVSGYSVASVFCVWGSDIPCEQSHLWQIRKPMRCDATVIS